MSCGIYSRNTSITFTSALAFPFTLSPPPHRRSTEFQGLQDYLDQNPSHVPLSAIHSSNSFGKFHLKQCPSSSLTYVQQFCACASLLIVCLAAARAQIPRGEVELSRLPSGYIAAWRSFLSTPRPAPSATNRSKCRLQSCIQLPGPPHANTSIAPSLAAPVHHLLGLAPPPQQVSMHNACASPVHCSGERPCAAWLQKPSRQDY